MSIKSATALRLVLRAQEIDAVAAAISADASRESNALIAMELRVAALRLKDIMILVLAQGVMAEQTAAPAKDQA